MVESKLHQSHHVNACDLLLINREREVAARARKKKKYADEAKKEKNNEKYTIMMDGKIKRGGKTTDQTCT